MAPTSVPFEPSMSDLQAQVTEIQTALDEYGATKATDEKPKALGRVSNLAERLSGASTSPGLMMSRIVFWPQACAVLPIGLGMGLIENLPEAGSATTAELAKKCSSEVDFTFRIARALASLDWVTEVSQGEWAHSSFSRTLLDPSAKASIAHMFDIVGLTMFRLNEFHEKYGYKTPKDILNTPTVFARGVQDMDYFEWLTRMAHNMTGVNGIGAKYRWDELPEGNEGIRVVDVGGGRGHVLKDLLDFHPNFAGQVCLEDLANVLEDDPLVSADVCKMQPYNFLKDDQPVKGASAYLFRHCLCDWPDDTVVDILRRQIPAMRGHDSKLLIADLILPDTGVTKQVALRDVNMMQLAGVERSESQWHAVMKSSGFRIVDMFNRQDQFNSVIEAVVDSDQFQNGSAH